ncbi:unnamed protein product [Dibothriocephalus latus]|uniref:Uncharacterized protein n=1 Tax=Dibothriocephalus latus TaxID=60516 RepID=A0A3P6SDD1_DIBLA|nr:unnamed protein product [Dibothriocephalus latus]
MNTNNDQGEDQHKHSEPRRVCKQRRSILALSVEVVEAQIDDDNEKADKKENEAGTDGEAEGLSHEERNCTERVPVAVIKVLADEETQLNEMLQTLKAELPVMDVETKGCPYVPGTSTEAVPVAVIKVLPDEKARLTEIMQKLKADLRITKTENEANGCPHEQKKFILAVPIEVIKVLTDDKALITPILQNLKAEVPIFDKDTGANVKSEGWPGEDRNSTGRVPIAIAEVFTDDENKGANADDKETGRDSVTEGCLHEQKQFILTVPLAVLKVLHDEKDQICAILQKLKAELHTADNEVATDGESEGCPYEQLTSTGRHECSLHPELNAENGRSHRRGCIPKMRKRLNMLIPKRFRKK